MHNRRIGLMIFILAAALGFGYLLGERKSQGGGEALVVRTYAVPPERAAEMKHSLNRLFFQKDGEAPSGSAQVFGSGLMMVKAPGNFQQGIERLVKDIGNEKEHKRDSIRLQYWLISGEEGKAANQNFGVLEPVIEAIQKVDGERRFKIQENLATVLVSGSKAKGEGAFTEIEFTAGQQGEKINLELQARSKLGKLESSTQIVPGEFVVLGQSAMRANGKDTGVPGTNVYHVVRAEILK